MVRLIYGYGKKQARKDETPLPPAIVRIGFGYETVRWFPDGKKVLMKILEEGLTIEKAAKQMTPTRNETEREDKSAKSTVMLYQSHSAKNKPEQSRSP